MRKLIVLLFALCLIQPVHAQDFGDLPKIPQAELHRDLDLLYQGLDSFHTGMYWYSNYDDVLSEFESARRKIDRDLNVLEFFNIVAPLVSLSREDHTDIFLSEITKNNIREQATFFPMLVVFLGTDLYCLTNASNEDAEFEGKKILSINGETPVQIVDKIGALFASDGFIEPVKYSDLRKFSFARYYYYFYGNLASFEIEFEDKTVILESVRLTDFNRNIANRRGENGLVITPRESLEFEVRDGEVAYLGLHSLSKRTIKQNENNNNLARFLRDSFAEIERRGIDTLIVDISETGGADEGNENLVFSYIGENYRKYKMVSAKRQSVVLDNGIDKPIQLRTFRFLERVFHNRRMADGSYERRENRGHGLRAYKKEPKYKYSGDMFVLISPVTYSGGSELANMIYTNELATFIGQETGGGYYGNTSGYSDELTLPNSQITIEIPALKFEMNVNESLPFGRGVIPHHQVIPSFDQYIAGENEALEFALNLIREKQ